jgi:hypothetical protein
VSAIVLCACWSQVTFRQAITERMQVAMCAELDAVLKAFPPEKQQEALREIQTRITNVMFVELLFEKGPREAEMINREYHWQNAVQQKMADLGYREDARGVTGAASVA